MVSDFVYGFSVHVNVCVSASECFICFFSGSFYSVCLFAHSGLFLLYLIIILVLFRGLSVL